VSRNASKLGVHFLEKWPSLFCFLRFCGQTAAPTGILLEAIFIGNLSFFIFYITFSFDRCDILRVLGEKPQKTCGHLEKMAATNFAQGCQGGNRQNRIQHPKIHKNQS